MNKVAEHCQKTGTVWRICVSGEPLGLTYWNRDAERPDALPTEESVRRVARAFKRWIEKTFPGKETPQSQYFVAFYEGAVKVYPSFRAEEERRKNGNHFRDQSEANLAAMALKWIVDKERERFENAS